MKYSFALLLLACTCTGLQAQWMDGGRTQSRSLAGNGPLLIYDGDMYFWNEENHFQISSDNGATWSNPPDSISGANPHVTRMSAAGGRVYAALNFGTGQGIPIYSTDRGVTWQPDTTGAPGHALGWGGYPAVSDIYVWGHWVYVKWDQPVPYTVKSFDGVFVSNDYMNIGGNNPGSVVAKGDTLFAAGSKIYYTTDGGETFITPANNGYSGFGGQLFVDGSRLYMFAYKAWGKPATLFYSDDNAENWNEIDVSSVMSRTVVGGSTYFPTTYFIKGNRIEFATVIETFNSPPNVWKSTDLGATWEQDTAGLPPSYVNGVVTFAYTPDGNLWVVPGYENIYRQKIDEGTGGGGKQVTAAPTTLRPQQGTQGALPMRFVWNAVTNATSYQLQIASDTVFASIASGRSDGSFELTTAFASITLDESGITDTTFSVASLAAADRYYWRVRGVGEGDQAGPWSDVADFSLSTSSVRVESESSGRIGPNPFHDRLLVEHSEDATSLELRDLLGRVVRSEGDLRMRARIDMDVRGLPSGSYWLIIYRAGESPLVSPIVVK